MYKIRQRVLATQATEEVDHNSPNRPAARSYFEEVLNCGNMSAADVIFASMRFHYPLQT
jgi:hypothetical protein